MYLLGVSTWQLCLTSWLPRVCSFFLSFWVSSSYNSLPNWTKAEIWYVCLIAVQHVPFEGLDFLLSLNLFYLNWRFGKSIAQLLLFFFYFSNTTIIYSARCRPKSLQIGQSAQFGSGLDIYELGWTWVKIQLCPILGKRVLRGQKRKIYLF